MRGMKFLVLACVVLALAAALPKCLSEEHGRRLSGMTAAWKRKVDLKRGMHPRRSSKLPDNFKQETGSDEFDTNVNFGFKNPAFVRDNREFALRGGRRLQSLPKEEGPVAKEWPVQFTISFTTKWGAATGLLAYDWVNQRQAIFHGPNSTFCQNLGTDEACQMLEIPSGTYVYIPSQNKCNLAVPGVGSVPPSWTVQSNYAGVELIPGIGLCRTFTFPPTPHVWGETVDGALPCVFVFSDPSSTYYFDPQTFALGAPDEKLFEFPDYCFGLSGSVASK